MITRNIRRSLGTFCVSIALARHESTSKFATTHTPLTATHTRSSPCSAPPSLLFRERKPFYSQVASSPVFLCLAVETIGDLRKYYGKIAA